jgi:cysteine desulfuration protein SufE
MTRKEIEIVEEFSLFDNWMDKYEHIIEIGKELKGLDKKYKTPEYEVKGCQSKVWLHSYLKDGKVVYEADSDAIITKGLIGLLVRALSNEKPEDIVKNELKFIEEIGLKQHLSPNRSSGLVAMIKQMKYYAIALNQS